MTDPSEIDRLINRAVRKLDEKSLVHSNEGTRDVATVVDQSYVIRPADVRIIHTVLKDTTTINKISYAQYKHFVYLNTIGTDELYWCMHELDSGQLRNRIILFPTPVEVFNVTFSGLLWHPFLSESVPSNYFSENHPDAILKMAASLHERKMRNHAEADKLESEAVKDLLGEYHDTIEEELASLPNYLGG